MLDRTCHSLKDMPFSRRMCLLLFLGAELFVQINAMLNHN